MHNVTKSHEVIFHFGGQSGLESNRWSLIRFDGLNWSSSNPTLLHAVRARISSTRVCVLFFHVQLYEIRVV